MLPTLLAILVLGPFAAAAACRVLRAEALRNFIVLATAVVLAACSVALYMAGPFAIHPWSGFDLLVPLADFSLLGIMFYYAIKLNSRLVKGLVLAQAIPLAVFELFVLDHGHSGTLVADELSLLMVLIISIVGSLICLFGLPYMRVHEQHHHQERSRQPGFFFYLLLLLGVMNGLVLSDDLAWVYFFFEITTFCSFKLIGHDQTEVAKDNAYRALWMGSIGGVLFVLGLFALYAGADTLAMTEILAAGPAQGAALFGVALICLAGFVKAAQPPLQGWLLGAMVAPTPVSALLHSSTMVKAGVYMVLRLAPAYFGSFFSDGVALAGGLTFLATAALAMGQSNGKRILAYSTIGNLGLIMACAGLNTPEAHAAAILLILFHAISKALLFLAVGTIEQTIGSLNIEDMRGLWRTMPRTAFLTVVGIATMLLPPFGVLFSKWLAIESAAANLPVVVLLSLGSAFSVVYWGRWAGALMSSPRPESPLPEDQDLLISLPLKLLAGAAVVLSLFTPVIYSHVVAPMVASAPPFTLSYGVLSTKIGAFSVYPLYVLLLAGVLFAWRMTKRAKGAKPAMPYMCAAHTGAPEDMTFTGPMNQTVTVKASNYYLEKIFGEERLTPVLNIAALVVICLMLGGAL